MPLAGLADPKKEVGRLEKQAKKLQKELDGRAGLVSSRIIPFLGLR